MVGGRKRAGKPQPGAVGWPNLGKTRQHTITTRPDLDTGSTLESSLKHQWLRRRRIDTRFSLLCTAIE